MADGLTSFAEAYHARASYEEKWKAEELYRKLGGDGNVTLDKIRGRFESWRKTDFQKLDSVGDGALKFTEFLVVFYHSKGAIKISSCHGCACKILGSYFSCKSCLLKMPQSQSQTCDLCCRCYRKGIANNHEHPLTDFLHNNGLLANYMRQAQTHKPKDETEEMRKIATLYFQAASPRVQQSAIKFFKSMDEDGDQGVDEQEFLSFMSRSRYRHLARKQVFKKLNVSGNGALNFMEVMTLCYIMQSRRPICDGCSVFIPGVFFSCVECFTNGTNPFNICFSCYQESILCPHTHARGGGIDFLDNYTLLQTIRETSLLSGGQDYQHQHGEASSSGAIVPAASSGKTKTDVAYAALELAISVSNTLNSIALTAGSMATSKCTIM